MIEYLNSCMKSKEFFDLVEVPPLIATNVFENKIECFFFNFFANHQTKNWIVLKLSSNTVRPSMPRRLQDDFRKNNRCLLTIYLVNLRNTSLSLYPLTTPKLTLVYVFKSFNCFGIRSSWKTSWNLL